MLLLDTHVLIWWLDGDLNRFSDSVLANMRDGQTRVYVSAASAWEIAIKSSKGKLKTPDDLPAVMIASRFKELPISISHSQLVRTLPHHHGDPFDRLLVAQAMAEKLTLVTVDKMIHRYDVKTLNPEK